MEIQKNEKVLAMYRAVWELLSEGYDISSMKVVDITSRAGIGKGTAYEYFRSKEEIVQEALKYDYYLQYENLLHKLEKQNTFRSALETSFDWLGENIDRKRFAVQFFNEPKYVRQEMQSAAKNQNEACQDAMYLINLIITLGRKDGNIRANITEEMATVQIVSQLFGYFLYQGHNEKNKKDLDEMKKFLCDNIEKSLK